jgi:predicted permease
MIRTFRALTHVHPGFRDPSQIQTLRISIPEAQIPDSEAERVIRMQEEILHRLASIQGVSIAGIGTKLPMTGMGRSDPVFVEGRPSAEGQFPALRRFKFVSPGYFSTMGIPLIAGRELSWDDTYKKIPVAVISENVARELWSAPSAALGKRIRVSSKDEWREVVGVVGDVHDDGVNSKPTASVYWPLLQKQFEGQSPSLRRDIVFVLRTPRAGSESFLKDVRQAVWSVNPNLPLSDVHPLEYFYHRSMARTSFTLVMLAVAGSMALLLGVVGIYGVIAYSVSQRTREIGIRMAVGAQRQTLTKMFVRHGLLLSSIGVLCGLAAAIPLMRLMSCLLFKVSPVDPVTYSAVCLGLVGTAFLASYLPSRRAATVDPVEALRAE